MIARWSRSTLVLACVLSCSALLIGCDGDRCIRHSDCASDLICQAGTCRLPPDAVDGAVFDQSLVPDKSVSDAPVADSAPSDSLATDVNDAQPDGLVDGGTDAPDA